MTEGVSKELKAFLANVKQIREREGNNQEIQLNTYLSVLSLILNILKPKDRLEIYKIILTLSRHSNKAFPLEYSELLEKSSVKVDEIMELIRSQVSRPFLETIKSLGSNPQAQIKKWEKTHNIKKLIKTEIDQYYESFQFFVCYSTATQLLKKFYKTESKRHYDIYTAIYNSKILTKGDRKKITEIVSEFTEMVVEPIKKYFTIFNGFSTDEIQEILVETFVGKNKSLQRKDKSLSDKIRIYTIWFLQLSIKTNSFYRLVGDHRKRIGSMYVGFGDFLPPSTKKLKDKDILGFKFDVYEELVSSDKETLFKAFAKFDKINFHN